GDSVGAELFHAQVTRAQGPFSQRQVIRVWALDYLAENIEAPAVTLHYPSRRELIRELRQGDYTHVGINFVVSTFHKVREMVRLIRQHSPAATIVLGGYGTVLPDDVLRPFADVICREEGVRFLQRLLGERDDRPIRHPHAAIPSVQVLGHQQSGVVGHVTAGLGCPNGCDFCCTSHFFRRKYVPFARTGRDIYEALMATRARAVADGQSMDSFILIDEDFFVHERRARQFLDCVREGGEPLSLMGFGSVKGLSQFTAREIAEMGFDVVWNAFEGTEAGYGKQEGAAIADLYRSLQSVGCTQLTSMIIGFPYQDEERMRAEFEALMALEPTFTQCLIYFAFPGTPFHAQVVAEGRYRERYRKTPDLRRWDGFAMHFEHPKFDDPERIETLQREFYDQDYRRLGPSPLRAARVWLTGYEHLRNDPNPLLAARAERLRKAARGIMPAIGAGIAFAPSRAARERARALRRDIIRLTGALTVAERVKEAATPLFYLGSRLGRAAGLCQQPGLLRTEHRTGAGLASQATAQVMKLQGAPRHGGLAALAEDFGERLRDLADQAWIHPAAGDFPGAEVINGRQQPMPRSVPCAAASSPQPRPLARAIRTTSPRPGLGTVPGATLTPPQDLVASSS
ncbi:MAG: cobalamin-dependent protein, partial [Deltaproteobacteria bacterium]|nr:cobalamin-dependent protein [Deltaproteobacteria bacterium]